MDPQTEFTAVQIVAIVQAVIKERNKFSLSTLNFYKKEEMVEPTGSHKNSYGNYYTLIDATLMVLVIRLKQKGVNIKAYQWAIPNIRLSIEKGLQYKKAFLTINDAGCELSTSKFGRNVTDAARAHELVMIYDIAPLCRFVVEAARSLLYGPRAKHNKLPSEQVAV